MDPVKWMVGIGFWLQGFRCFPWLGVNFFLKDTLAVPPSFLQLLQNSANLPMVAKPLYGLLSDSVPIHGQRRLPYVAIGALLQAIAWLAIGLWPGSAISVSALTVFLLLSNLGASIAEVANDAIVAEADKPQKQKPSTSSGKLQSFAWMFGSSAGALGNLLGGIAISSNLSPKLMFIFYGIILIFQFFITICVSEKSLNLPNPNNKPKSSSSGGGFRKQLSEMSFALRQPDIFRSLVWFSASYAMTPLLLGTTFFYQTEYLNLDSSIIGLSKVIGQASLLIWSIVYEKYFKRVSPRKVLSVLQLAMVILMLSDVLFVKGIYRGFGIPDWVYVLIFSGLSEAAVFVKVLPFSVLVAKLCPPGCEGSVMAFVMSALALATIVSGYFGVALASFLGVSGNDFSNLPLCILIEAGCTMLPLLGSSWISEGKVAEKKKK
ncbi:putative folate-biopterin transporter 7 isoform X1 [Carex rostrata]